MIILINLMREKIRTKRRNRKMKFAKLLLSIVIVSLLVSMAIPLAAAPKPPDKPGGGGGKDKTPPDPEIAFSAGESLGRLRVMDADGGNAATIYSGGGIKRTMSWSPGGETLAFSMSDIVWLIDVDENAEGSNMRFLVDGGRPAWSPSTTNSEIAFVASDTIQVIAPTGGSTTLLYTVISGNSVGDMAWNADGTLLAFYERVDSSPYVSVVNILDRASKTIVDTYSTTDFSISSFKGISWARTQNVIAVVSGPEQIYLLDLDTGDFTLLTNGRYPTWSPDDSAMAFQKKEKTQFNIKSIDMGSGQISKLTRDGWYPDWKR
jgi:Tol biopolymer transport system component